MSWLRQAEIPQRFTDSDEALSFYNGWIQVSPTSPPEAETDPEFKWDPVLKWYTTDGSPLYWYIVGTKDAESLVIETPETFMRWANEYYHYYAREHGEAEAEALIERGRIVVEKIPDLPASTPEAEHLIEQVAESAPEGREESEDRKSSIEQQHMLNRRLNHRLNQLTNRWRIAPMEKRAQLEERIYALQIRLLELTKLVDIEELKEKV